MENNSNIHQPSSLGYSVIISILGYTLGAFIFYLLDTYLMIAYSAVSLATIYIIIKYRCRFCPYYGKHCPSGRGIMAKLIFKKADIKDFNGTRGIIIPSILDFAVLLLPVLASALLLYINFSYFTVGLLFLYLVGAIFPGLLLKQSPYCGIASKRSWDLLVKEKTESNDSKIIS